MKDLLNLKFGKLTVIAFDRNEKRKLYWLCRCECGVEKVIAGNHLKSQKTKSCGCHRREVANFHGLFKDLTGQRFHKLLVLSHAGKSKCNKHQFFCQCDCGAKKGVNSADLLSGATKSCGCARAEAGLRNRKLIDGIPVSNWSQLLRHASKVERREVKITPKQAFEQFVKQGEKCALSGRALILRGRGYTKGQRGNASLDRIDSSKPYTVDNIQWVDKEINKLKSDFPEARFIELCQEVSEYAKRNRQ